MFWFLGTEFTDGRRRIRSAILKLQLGIPLKKDPVTPQLARLHLRPFTKEAEDELIQNKSGFQRLNLSSLTAAPVIDAPLKRHCAGAVDRLS